VKPLENEVNELKAKFAQMQAEGAEIEQKV
jgi:hypothetical protein